MPVTTALRRLSAVVAACALLLPSGTAAAQEASPEPSPSLVPLPAETPAGAWDVAAYDPWGAGLEAPSGNTTLTVVLLDDGRLEGETGCGRYFGSWSEEGERVSLSVVSAFSGDCSTKKTEVAVALSVALGSVATWAPTADGIELLDEAGVSRVDLQREAGGGPFGDWLVEYYTRPNGTPAEPLPKRPMELTLNDDGTLTGSSGCRLLEGRHTVDGDRIVIGPVEAVGLPCEDKVRKAERQLLRALGESTLWEREGSTLTLIDAFGEPSVELRDAVAEDQE